MKIQPACSVAYNTGLLLSWPFLYGYYRLRMAKDGKYSENHRFRLGLERVPDLSPAPRTWVHALSVGEVLSVVPLVKALFELAPHREIVFSTAAESGQAIARQRLSPWVNRFFYAPHDFPWLVKDVVGRVKPSLFLLVETDLWPNWLRELERAGIPAVLVNGRVSPPSFRLYRRFRPLISQVFNKLQRVFAQSREDGLRYAALGVPENRVRVAGNLKEDLSPHPPHREEKARLRRECSIPEDRPVWIAGSTHEGEEAMVLDVHRKLAEERRDLLLILAPRNPARASEISTLCARRGWKWVRRSTREPAGSKDVLILDTLGELARFYALARAAFVGGSLTPAGGHNPLEAVAQGVPVWWGPGMHNFRELERDLTEADCGRRVDSKEELARELRRALDDDALRRRFARAAQDFLEERQGRAAALAREILEMLDG